MADDNDFSNLNLSEDMLLRLRTEAALRRVSVEALMVLALDALNGPKDSAPATNATGQYTGIVKWFNEEKGYGFILPDNGDRDIFVHYTGVNGSRYLIEGQRVRYDVKVGERGIVAVNVDVIDVKRSTRGLS